MGLVLVCVNLYVVTFGIKKIKEVKKRTSMLASLEYRTQAQGIDTG